MTRTVIDHPHDCTIRAETINEQDRTVEATIMTRGVVVVADNTSGKPEAIDEVVIPEGGVLPPQVPMLNTHRRGGLEDVFGSASAFRIENGVLVGRLRFSGDPVAWGMVTEGHITDVSPGYLPLEYTMIRPGQTRSVAGQEYTAKPTRPLRVVTKWRLREVSLVPVGADPAAKIRAEEDTEGGDSPMTVPTPPAAPAPIAPPVVAPLAEVVRAAIPAPIPPAPAAPVDVAEVKRQAIAEDRARAAEIRAAAGGVIPEETVRKAIDEGWDVAKAQGVFLETLRGRFDKGAPKPSRSGDGPAIHHHDRDAETTREVLAAAMIQRSGMDPLKDHLRANAAMMDQDSSVARLTQDQAERAAEYAHRYRSMSLVDVCREACRLEGVRVNSYSRDEVVRAAVSTASLANIFTTNVNARLVASYQEAGDSTKGWCAETDFANFMTHERTRLSKTNRLTPHKRGGTANHATRSDEKVEYKIARYSQQFVVDEQDIIDDRFDALKTFPDEMGAACARLRPDLVYSILLANPSMADSIALFHASHNNLGTTSSALAAATLQAAIVAIAKQKEGAVNLNLKPRYLIVPQDLVFTAEILLTSAERIIAASSDGTYNPLKNRGIEVVADNRIGVSGVVDPASINPEASATAGTATNWFLLADPAMAATIEVAYRTGTNRSPATRPFTLTQGQWGLGWDINMDIGAKAVDWRGAYKATGAGP